MKVCVTTRDLFYSLQAKAGLEWVTDPVDDKRVFELSKRHRDTNPFIGLLGVIRPKPIQIIGVVEADYLNRLNLEFRRLLLDQLVAGSPFLIFICSDADPPQELQNKCAVQKVPLVRSDVSEQELVDFVHRYFEDFLNPPLVLHGVFVNIFGVGVVLRGDRSVIGKSELALDLITRGHRLIADDVPEFIRVGSNRIIGQCPELLRGFIEVFGLGILNLRKMFGENAIEADYPLDLIVQLIAFDENRNGSPEQRLEGIRGEVEILGVKVPRIDLPVGPGRNPAVLVEAAVRDHTLRCRGYFGAQELCSRQQQAILDEPP